MGFVKQLPPMVVVPQQTFLMGSSPVGGGEQEDHPGDGVIPARSVSLSSFSISATAVSNEQWSGFVTQTHYKTDAERFGASFVFGGLLPTDFAPTQGVVGAEWWRQVEGATWRQPEGPGSTLADRADHPVVHISWNDALAFCEWAGTRLPSEAEWECAARGGLEQKRFPWGDEFAPGGVQMCNIFQGEFPASPTAPVGTVRVDAFPANGYGLHNVSGNVWEWCGDSFGADQHEGDPNESRVIRGGSYLCHDSYCNRYRVAARSANTADASVGNLGFRIAR